MIKSDGYDPYSMPYDNGKTTRNLVNETNDAIEKIREMKREIEFEKSKKFLISVQGDNNKNEETQFPTDLSLKEKVNLFLWEVLGDDVTFGEAEDIACRIVDVIVLNGKE